jgi:hypothetical protein
MYREVMKGPADFNRTLLSRMQALGRIRLARGVVGKARVVAGIALLALSAISWRIEARFLLWVVGAVLLLFFAYLAAVLWFAHRHPEQALLEGAEIIQCRQQEMAKGLTCRDLRQQRRHHRRLAFRRRE